MKKTVGIIGAGNIAKAVAVHLVRAGHPVILSSRKDPSSLAGMIHSIGEGARAGTPTEAAEADLVLLALPWAQLASLTELTNWSDKIVMDATNHFISFAPDFEVADLGNRSSSEVVADYVPGAHVVKAFNTLYFKLLEADPREASGNRVLFMAGDNAEAKREVSTVIESLGFSPVDLGTLATGGKLQQAKGPLAAINLIKKQ
jgi:predicted dinucleotide-binding enzyme